MTAPQGVLFDERFLDRYAGAIISVPEVAIVELVANAWDAWATRVEIEWPEKGSGRVFSITDNGKGMTHTEFRRRWATFDYDRQSEQGRLSPPPEELKSYGPRRPYGRNGKGRHAAFLFGDPYRVRTWRDDEEVTYEVRRGLTAPFDLELVASQEQVPGHGTQICAPFGGSVGTTAQQVREAIGTRFLSDPSFTVLVDGKAVTFQDVPSAKLREIDVQVPGHGVAHLTIIDTLKADKTTRQHGIAWWIDARLVGSPGWAAFDLDGRTSEAKRFLFIVRADFLADAGATLSDWSGFDARSEAWIAAQDAVRLTGATLIIAKLDRLSRDAHFLLGLQKAEVDFVACDMPSADRFTVGIMAMLAQKERELISERTKAALAAAKARGRQLGNPKGAAHLRHYGNARAIEALRMDAQERAERLRRIIAELRSSGVNSANGLAKALNERHVATARGGAWTARSVLNVIERL